MASVEHYRDLLLNRSWYAEGLSWTVIQPAGAPVTVDGVIRRLRAARINLDEIRFPHVNDLRDDDPSPFLVAFLAQVGDDVTMFQTNGSEGARPDSAGSPTIPALRASSATTTRTLTPGSAAVPRRCGRRRSRWYCGGWPTRSSDRRGSPWPSGGLESAMSSAPSSARCDAPRRSCSARADGSARAAGGAGHILDPRLSGRS
ncbi:hypothetical protein AB0K00_53025 [Dactylosporangium sp. NPDC049525]|uniref:hypothetical protein n=1 Tax=Dactylosporangium sp. NPDC049525 TaxID=3154730 RepID=UPI00343660E6